MQTFQTPAAITAILDIPAGRIQLIAADRTDTAVEVRPADAAKSRDVKLAEQVTVEFTDGVLRVAAAPPKHKLLGHNGSVEVTVKLPAGSAVRARTSAGDIRGVGRLGDVTAETAQGPIKLDETAAATLTVLDGAVTVGRLGGAAEISTQRGDITVAEAVTGTVTLTSQLGNLSIGAAPESSATLDAGTTMGRVTNALKNSEGAAAELTIRATTAKGDITARSI
ncbi:DUF4097 family beta strand repeat-containing protein [Catenulispora yoronensis]|uniref:DUF4097 family beta strand repeat-containing protein n=1 Tax=Catenulispora yoronensis TaxID=450799 RepID=A0ABP5EZV7_9ACTN